MAATAVECPVIARMADVSRERERHATWRGQSRGHHENGKAIMAPFEASAAPTHTRT
jgi:hypothetical protein